MTKGAATAVTKQLLENAANHEPASHGLAMAAGVGAAGGLFGGILSMRSGPQSLSEFTSQSASARACGAVKKLGLRFAGASSTTWAPFARVPETYITVAWGFLMG